MGHFSIAILELLEGKFQSLCLDGMRLGFVLLLIKYDNYFVIGDSAQ